MGGCRCTFRDCQNGTATRKELHYFRFPVRDPERLKVWARNANREDFLELPMDKLTNKVVCQEHFERMMFMNDLRDRLTKLAIPRLMPLSESTVLDVESNTVQWVYDNDPLEDLAGATVTSWTAAQDETSEASKDPTPSSHGAPPTKKIKILNSQTLLLNQVDKPCEIVSIKPATPTGSELVRRISRSAAHKTGTSQTPNAVKHQTVHVASQSDQKSGSLIDFDDISMEDVYLHSEVQSSVDAGTSASHQEDAPNSTVAIVAPAVPTTVTVPVIDPALKEKLEQNSREMEEMKKLVQQLVNRPEPKPVPVHMATIPTKVVMEKGPQLTKAQLFNGIKRYLNPTMVTLLRMELFAGASERQWKSDEKTLAVELLGMGETVYDFFKEEFRFRLPAKGEAKLWKDSGELDADDAC